MSLFHERTKVLRIYIVLRRSETRSRVHIKSDSIKRTRQQEGGIEIRWNGAVVT